jgi:glutaredoxin
MSFSFDLAKLKGIIDESKAKSGGDGGAKNFTNTSYLQEGTHKIRPFVDPQQNLFRQVVYHKGRPKTLCPDDLNKKNSKNPNWAKQVQAMDPSYAEQKDEAGNVIRAGLTELPACEICKAAKEINSWKSGLGLKIDHLMYANFYETSVSGDQAKYLKADKQNGVPYVIVGNKKMKDHINQMIETFSTDAQDYVLGMLNPTLNGGIISMSVTRGNQGSVGVTAIPGAMKPALFDESSLPEWFRPLTQVFIGTEFKKADYDEGVKNANAKLAEHREKIAKGEKVHSNDDDKDPAEAGEAAQNGAVAEQNS